MWPLDGAYKVGGKRATSFCRYVPFDAGALWSVLRIFSAISRMLTSWKNPMRFHSIGSAAKSASYSCAALGIAYPHSFTSAASEHLS